MAAQVRAALVRLGLQQPAAVFTTDNMGLDSLFRWRDAHLDEDLIDYSKMLRSPAGTIVQAGQEVRHPGFQVSLMALSNLKIMRLALKYHELIQRPVAPADIDLVWIANHEFLVDHVKMAVKKTVTKEDLPIIKMNDWALTNDRIITHFTGVFGRNGAPLSYLLRENANVPMHPLDPQINYQGDYIREMIARTAHGTRFFDADNRDMCRLIRIMVGETAAFAYIMEFTANGRAAWLRLMAIYLGPQHTNNQATIYENKLMNATYDGESNRFGFDKYMEIHKTAHSHLASLIPYGYTGIDEGTKIRHFLQGIKTDKLKTVIEVVRGSPDYNTFEEVARRLKDAVVLMQPNRIPRRNIADVRRDGQQPFADVDADMNVEDKYYKPKDWAKLSAAKKKGVLAKRAKRNGGSALGKRKETKFSKKQIATLARQVAALNVQDPNDDAEDSKPVADQATKRCKTAVTNRTHPATTRQS